MSSFPLTFRSLPFQCGSVQQTAACQWRAALTNWSVHAFSLLTPPVCHSVTPHHHEPVCACEGITSGNRSRVPSDVFTLTEHKVLVCLNLLKSEASQNIISPVQGPGTWVALMVCHAGRTDLENSGCPVRPFARAPRYISACLDAQTRKEGVKKPTSSERWVTCTGMSRHIFSLAKTH